MCRERVDPPCTSRTAMGLSGRTRRIREKGPVIEMDSSPCHDCASPRPPACGQIPPTSGQNLPAEEGVLACPQSGHIDRRPTSATLNALGHSAPSAFHPPPRRTVEGQETRGTPRQTRKSLHKSDALILVDCLRSEFTRTPFLPHSHRALFPASHRLSCRMGSVPFQGSPP